MPAHTPRRPRGSLPTATAVDQLLEAIAALGQGRDEKLLPEFASQLRGAAKQARAKGHTDLAKVWTRLDSLFRSVADDLRDPDTSEEEG